MTIMNDELQRQYDSISHVGAERAVLSIAMQDPDTLFDIATDLGPDDFTNASNRNIYQIMLTVLDGAVANIAKVNPSVISALALRSGLQDTVTVQYLDVLARTNAGAENLKFFVGQVRQASVRRKSFMQAISVMREAIDNEDEDIETFTARQESKFLDIILETNGNNEVIRLGDCIDAVVEKRAATIREILGIPSGMTEYDRVTGGLVPGRLKVWAAPAKTGKSAMGLNVAINIAVRQGLPVLYIDTEMTTEEQIDRAISILATEILGRPVAENVVSRGLFARDPEKMRAVQQAKELIKASPFYHIYMPDFTPEKVHNLARKMQRQIGVDWNGYSKQMVLIFDYIKMPDATMGNGNVSEYLLLGQITSMLKNQTAGMLNIPVLAFAQLNPRTTQNAEDVDSSHMSGSNRIVMFVNELAFLRKKTQEEMERDGRENGNIVFKLGETRNGGSYLGWIDYTTRFGVCAMKELRNVAMAG